MITVTQPRNNGTNMTTLRHFQPDTVENINTTLSITSTAYSKNQPIRTDRIIVQIQRGPRTKYDPLHSWCQWRSKPRHSVAL